MTLQKFLFVLCFLNVFCKSNQKKSASLKSKNENDKHFQEIENVLIDSFTKNKFEMKYNELEGNLYIKITSNPNELIKIGSFHNSFNQPPHEIKIQDLGNQYYAILIFTNNVQVGISEDQLNAFIFNLQNYKIVKVCSFEELGKYSEISGIDTISNIKLYDYKIQKTMNNKKYEIEVLEYKPFKYFDESKNKNLVIKMVKKNCIFKL